TSSFARFRSVVTSDRDNCSSRDDIWSLFRYLSRVICVIDLLDHALAQQAARKEFYAVVVHSLQQLLSAFIHVANTREVNQKRRVI
ncbi:MAG TPA: hypothetical protein VFR12_06190, partial [Pyrinomonadaceae bacterium]|nr:hypothetical protein [Pyrinomonadaceae bacterium]